jgi:hypothetical protein
MSALLIVSPVNYSLITAPLLLLLLLLLLLATKGKESDATSTDLLRSGLRSSRDLPAYIKRRGCSHLIPANNIIVVCAL